MKLLLVFLCLSACRSTHLPESGKGKADSVQPSIEKKLDDSGDYEIFTSVISKYTASPEVRMIVLEKLITGYSQLRLVLKPDEVVSRLKNLGAGVECIKDFEEKNREAWEIQRQLDLKKKYAITTGESGRIREDLLNGIDGWKEFYKRFPGSDGIYFLSRPGICKKGNKAVLLLAHSSSADAGWGTFILLKRDNDKKWRVEDEDLIWMS